MTGFSEDNHAPLRGMVVSRRLCADCATVIPAYGGGSLRIEHIPDTADLPNPRNPPSRLHPPAKTVHGEIDTNKPAGAPPARNLSGPTKPSDLPKTAPVQTPPPGATTAAAERGAGRDRPDGDPGRELPGRAGDLLVCDKIFQRNWADAMARVDSWLQTYLPAYRPQFEPGSQLFAIVQVDIGTGDMYMGPGGGWSGTAPGVRVEEIRVADHPVMPFTWIEKSPWWTRLLGFSYQTTHLRFSFALPEAPSAERVPIDAGPRQRTPIRTSRHRTPIAAGGSQPRVPIRSGGGPARTARGRQGRGPGGRRR